MLGVSKPGAPNFYTLFRFIPLTLFVSRSLTSIYLPLSKSLNSLLCDSIAPTPGLVYVLQMLLPLACVDTLAAASSFLSSSSSFGRVPHFQMLTVMVLSQHCVSTSKTVSPRIPVGARCTGHVRMMCSAVCSTAPHSQFDVGARPHLCMND